FVALNGGPQFKFTEATSFSVNCETQDEIDYFWEKLSTDGGSTGRCGWLKDKFGLSWQINPVFLRDMLADPDAGKANRVIKAMMEMDKIDIAALEKAAQGRGMNSRARGWSSVWLALRSLLWTILLPGVFAGYVPWRFFGLARTQFDLTSPTQ